MELINEEGYNSMLLDKLTNRSILFSTVASILMFLCASPSGLFGQTYNGGESARVLVVQSIDESKLVTLAGNTPSESTVANDRGAAPDSLPIDHMQLVLQRPPALEEELETLMQDQQNKESPQYHKWLTAEEFGQRFGVSRQDIATVSAWLRSHGFTVDGVPPSGMFIEFSGNAGQVKAAFHTEIHNLEVDGQPHIANMTDPRIPEALAEVVKGVHALHNFMPHSMMKRRSQFTFCWPILSDCSTETTFYAVTPADLATIYNFNPAFSAGYTGAGQTIAVIEDTLLKTTSDVATFRTAFGLSEYSGTFSQITATGTTTCNNSGINSAEGEAALDAEWAGASAPNAAIKLASCADTTTVFGGLIALQNLINGSSPPPIVSISYGECEAQNGAAANASYVSTYQQAAALGVSVFVSAGDEGAASCDANRTVATHGIAVSGFASTPYNVAVGGTDFGDYYASKQPSGLPLSTYWSSSNTSIFGSAKSYIPEIPWDDSCASELIYTLNGYSQSYGSTGFCNSATGKASFRTVTSGSGGPSSYSSQPAWQTGFGLPTQTGGHRYLPDVSLFAADGAFDHFFEYCMTDASEDGSTCDYTNASYAYNLAAGGTSFSSPIMAGIQALINQAQGGKAQGNPNPTYYSLAAAEYGASGYTQCNSSLGTGEASYCIFNDVTLGDMDVNCKGALNCYGTTSSSVQGALSTSSSILSIAYGATAGWDYATGLGSVNVLNLIKEWDGVATTTGVTSGTNPSSLNASVIFTATVSSAFGAVGTGTVEWSSNTGCAESSVSAGSASCTTSALAGGPNTVQATYLANSSFASSSGSVQQTVTAGAPASVTATGSTTISVAASAAFGPTALQVQVLDVHGNPVGGVAVTYSAPATGASATLGTATCVTNASGICSVIPTANALPGAYTITASVGGVTTPATFSVTNTGPVTYTVTVATDTTAGVAANCTENGTTDPSCSLRDAIAAAATLPASSSIPVTIQFAPALTSGGAATITEGSAGTLTIGTNMSIVGPGQTLLAIDGANANTVLNVNSGVTASISGLTVQHGNYVIIGQNGAGGVYSQGALTVTNSSIVNNYTTGSGGGLRNYLGSLTLVGCTVATNTAYTGGGVFSQGGPLVISGSSIAGNALLSNGTLIGGGGVSQYTSTVSISNSTISGNSAPQSSAGGLLLYQATGTLTNVTMSGNSVTAYGGGILNYKSSLTLIETTVTGNSSTDGGGIFNDAAALILKNSVVAGNTATKVYPNIYKAVTDDGGNYFDTVASGSTLNPELAALGNYGGSTQTQPGLPGSPVLCAGLVSNVGSLTTDQRGDPRIATYGSTQCVDAGAVQTAYSLSFSTQPSNTETTLAISPAPAVLLSDNGVAIQLAGAPISMTLANGMLNGTTTENTQATGKATFAGLSVPTVETGDTLTASAAAGANTVTATSNTFNVLRVPPTASSVSAVTTTYGSTTGITVTATETGSAGSASGGVVTFSLASGGTGSFSPASCTLSGSACTTTFLPSGRTAAGTYTGDIVASFAAAGNYSAASATNTLTIAKAQLTVTANSATRLIDTANPAFTYTITGFKGTDTVSVVSGSATEATTATATSAPGGYPITFATESLTAANYSFTYVNGILTIEGKSKTTIARITSTTATIDVFGFGVTAPSGTLSFTDTTSGSPVSSPVTLNAATATTALTPQVTTSTGADSLPDWTQLGDINGDGKLDLVTSLYQTDSVSVQSGNGDGTFRAATNILIAAGFGPAECHLVSLRGNGTLDLIVGSFNVNKIAVLLGNGDGTFQRPVFYTAGSATNTPTSLTTGDFNDDGKLDVAVANSGDNTIEIFLGNGSGALSLSGGPVGVGRDPIAIRAGDFNGDGYSDLAVANYDSGTVTTLLNNHNGTFTATTISAGSGVHSGPEALAVTGSGSTLKLAVANYLDNTVSLLKSNGNGRFGAQTIVAVGKGPDDLQFADFNGDGVQDLAVSNYIDGSVDLLLGSSGGSYTLAGPFLVGDSPYSVSVGDFNSDGTPDLVVANCFSNNTGALLGGTQISVPYTGLSLTPGDALHAVYTPDGSSKYGASTSATVTAP